MGKKTGRRGRKGRRTMPKGVSNHMVIPYTYTTGVTASAGTVALSFNAAQFGLASGATYQMFTNLGTGTSALNVQLMFRMRMFKVNWEPYYGTSVANGSGAGAVGYQDGSNGYATSITTETIMGLRKHRVFLVGQKLQEVWTPSHPNDRLWNTSNQNSIFCQTVLPDAGFTFYMVASGCGTGTLGILVFTALLEFMNP
jgi:hypothetical protein